ncbi:MAG TPA: DUF305 domain-containing protein [Gemmatimonadaceae bacterium]
MKMPILPRTLPALLAGACVVACAGSTRPVPAAASAPAAATSAPATPATPARPALTGHAADVRFMQDMIAHHGQAIVMAALVPTHSTRDDMKLLAQRIDVSQHSEIATMQQWLRDHGETVPSPDASAMGRDMQGHDMAGMAHDSAAMPLMPGMLTDAELARLGAARGAEFDRLFLQFMIRHHQGALSMVGDLFSTPGAAQDPQVFGFASDVDTDQRAEIARMKSLLAALGGGQ